MEITFATATETIAPTTIETRWHTLWETWLNMNSTKRRSGSQHTQRSYRQATERWFAFLGDTGAQPWTASAFDVRRWQEQLAAGDAQHRPLSPAAINQRLAACSSFYSFVSSAHFHEAGRLHTLYEDHDGRPLPNPFQGAVVPRLRVTRTSKEAKFWWPGETDQLLADLERRRKTLTGSRNYALILGYLLTGYRSMEFVSLQWGAIRPHRQQPGAWVVEWQGKGSKHAVDPLPARVYDAITAHLRIAGRDPETMRPEEYIFKPLVTHNQHNLRHAPSQPGPHLSTKQVESILKGALRRAGVAPRGRIVHGLRHTFAERHYRNKKDLEALRTRLHHSNVATTSIYVKTEFPDDPVDDFSEEVYQGLFMKSE